MASKKVQNIGYTSKEKSKNCQRSKGKYVETTPQKHKPKETKIRMIFKDTIKPICIKHMNYNKDIYNIEPHIRYSENARISLNIITELIETFVKLLRINKHQFSPRIKNRKKKQTSFQVKPMSTMVKKDSIADMVIFDDDKLEFRNSFKKQNISYLLERYLIAKVTNEEEVSIGKATTKLLEKLTELRKTCKSNVTNSDRNIPLTDILKPKFFKSSPNIKRNKSSTTDLREQIIRLSMINYRKAYNLVQVPQSDSCIVTRIPCLKQTQKLHARCKHKTDRDLVSNVGMSEGDRNIYSTIKEVCKLTDKKHASNIMMGNEDLQKSFVQNGFSNNNSREKEELNSSDGKCKPRTKTISSNKYTCFCDLSTHLDSSDEDIFIKNDSYVQVKARHKPVEREEYSTSHSKCLNCEKDLDNFETEYHVGGKISNFKKNLSDSNMNLQAVTKKTNKNRTMSIPKKKKYRSTHHLMDFESNFETVNVVCEDQNGISFTGKYFNLYGNYENVSLLQITNNANLESRKWPETKDYTDYANNSMYVQDKFNFRKCDEIHNKPMPIQLCACRLGEIDSKSISRSNLCQCNIYDMLNFISKTDKRKDVRKSKFGTTFRKSKLHHKDRKLLTRIKIISEFKYTYTQKRLKTYLEILNINLCKPNICDSQGVIMACKCKNGDKIEEEITLPSQDLGLLYEDEDDYCETYMDQLSENSEKKNTNQVKNCEEPTPSLPELMVDTDLCNTRMEIPWLKISLPPPGYYEIKKMEGHPKPKSICDCWNIDQKDSVLSVKPEEPADEEFNCLCLDDSGIPPEEESTRISPESANLESKTEMDPEMNPEIEPVMQPEIEPEIKTESETKVDFETEPTPEIDLNPESETNLDAAPPNEVTEKEKEGKPKKELECKCVKPVDDCPTLDEFFIPSPLKFVYDWPCDSTNEGYMDPIYRMYPDDCDKTCGPQTEIPWNDIVLPKNIRLRATRKQASSTQKDLDIKSNDAKNREIVAADTGDNKQGNEDKLVDSTIEIQLSFTEIVGNVDLECETPLPEIDSCAGQNEYVIRVHASRCGAQQKSEGNELKAICSQPCDVTEEQKKIGSGITFTIKASKNDKNCNIEQNQNKLVPTELRNVVTTDLEQCNCQTNDNDSIMGGMYKKTVNTDTPDRQTQIVTQGTYMTVNNQCDERCDPKEYPNNRSTNMKTELPPNKKRYAPDVGSTSQDCICKDPVIAALETYQAEMEPLRNTLNQLRTKIDSLNIPELNDWNESSRNQTNSRNGNGSFKNTMKLNRYMNTRAVIKMKPSPPPFGPLPPRSYPLGNFPPVQMPNQFGFSPQCLPPMSPAMFGPSPPTPPYSPYPQFPGAPSRQSDYSCQCSKKTKKKKRSKKTSSNSDLSDFESDSCPFLTALKKISSKSVRQRDKSKLKKKKRSTSNSGIKDINQKRSRGKPSKENQSKYVCQGSGTATDTEPEIQVHYGPKAPRIMTKQVFKGFVDENMATTKNQRVRIAVRITPSGQKMLENDDLAIEDACDCDD